MFISNVYHLINICVDGVIVVRYIININIDVIVLKFNLLLYY